MKINQLASKPKLIKLVIDDEDTIKSVGEEVEFWTWDRQPLETFMKLANASQGNQSEMIDIIRTLILDEDGKQVINNEVMVPSSILLKMIEKLISTLGK